MIATLFFMGLVIGSNNLAAALAIGTLGAADRRWRILLVFGAFEFLMPLVGYWVGEQFSSVVGELASALSAFILLGLAAVAFYAAAKPAKTDERMARRITTWKGLVLLELGLSLDNLVAGFGGRSPPIHLMPARQRAFFVFERCHGLRVHKRKKQKRPASEASARP